MVHAGCFNVSIIHQSLDLNYGIFNVHSDENACECTRGCTDTVTGSTLKVESGRKIPCRTGESKLRCQHAGVMLYHPSYIPPWPEGAELPEKLWGLAAAMTKTGDFILRTGLTIRSWLGNTEEEEKKTC